MHNRFFYFAIIGLVLGLGFGLASQAQASIYEVGPGQELNAIGEVPWDNLMPGDEVNIHWRAEPYREKWVICRRGSAESPIIVRGIAGTDGARPVISGDGATTPAGLNFWNEPRGLLKVGGANHPDDTTPGYILVEGLHFMSARPGYFFTNDNGNNEEYVNNAAAVYVEKAEHFTLRNCELSDSGNGLFIGVNGGLTQNILIEANDIHGNGIENSYYEHNSYTSALGITFQYNHYGPLRADCGGNNLKDRSAGLVVRYNWIENGNRQLDLVDGEDSATVVDDSDYHSTMVYGNVLTEADGEGNAQIMHYGGDSGDTDIYRKGTLFFFNNTVISTRSGNTTLLRLSTNEESAFVFNNVIYTSASGEYLAMLGDNGQLTLQQNWIKSGFVSSHEGNGFNGQITDNGGNIEADIPGFVDVSAEDFHLLPSSAAINVAMPLPNALLPDHAVLMEYVKNLGHKNRAYDGQPDLGAFEYCVGDCPAADAGLNHDAASTQPDAESADDAQANDLSSPADHFARDNTNLDAGTVASPQDAGSENLGREAGCGCASNSPGYNYLFLCALFIIRRTKNR